MEIKPLIDVDVVARILDKPASSVYEAARRGTIPCVRIGRSVRFDPEAIADLVRTGGRALPGGWRREPAETPR